MVSAGTAEEAGAACKNEEKDRKANKKNMPNLRMFGRVPPAAACDTMIYSGYLLMARSI
jgi:hypothetical protein